MPDVKPIPDGYSVITPYLIVNDAAGFLEFLDKAFGAVERLRIPMPGGTIGHAEVEINGAALMVSDVAGTAFRLRGPCYTTLSKTLTPPTNGS